MPGFQLFSVLVVCCSLFSGNAFASQFGAPTNYSTAFGNGPVGVAVGDVNGDGHLDVVSADENGGTISVWLGNGDGTLRPSVRYPAGVNPFFVALADINHDGHLDAVVCNRPSFGNGAVTILLGNGDGTFMNAVSYGQFADAFSLVVGDFNGDGNPDIALGDTTVGSLLLGNGDGTFQAAQSIGVPGVVAFAVGDFNGDHLLDLVAAENNARYVVPLLNTGSGFSSTTRYHVNTPPISLVVGDFNHDGILDIASADEALNNLHSNVAVLLGKRNGTFHQAVGYPVGAEPRSIAAADFNHDGNLDIVTANEFFSGSISLLLGKKNGTFQPAITVTTAGNPTSIAVGDLNEDGWPDLVVTDPGVDAVSVLLNRGN